MSPSRLGQPIAERKRSQGINCAVCHLVHPEGARFCLNCGTALATTGLQRGTALVPGAQFCHEYGYTLPRPQSPTSALVPAEAPSILAETAPQLPVDAPGRCPNDCTQACIP